MRREHVPCRWTPDGSPGKLRVLPGGFSLIELLVVAAILGVLIAILVPGLARARTQVKRLACQSNLRQLALAWHHYLQDSRGYFLQETDAEFNYGGKIGQRKAPNGKPLNPYVRLPKNAREGAEVFHCPGDQGGARVRSCFDQYGTSYVMNPLLVGPPQVQFSRIDPCYGLLTAVGNRRGGLNRSKITVNESRLVLMGDYGWLPAWQVASTERIEWHGRPYGHNVAFLDGHAEFVYLRKGLHVTPEYNVIPFADAMSEIMRVQQSVPLK